MPNHTPREFTTISWAGAGFAILGFFGALAVEWLSGPGVWSERMSSMLIAAALGIVFSSGIITLRNLIRSYQP